MNRFSQEHTPHDIRRRLVPSVVLTLGLCSAFMEIFFFCHRDNELRTDGESEAGDPAQRCSLLCG